VLAVVVTDGLENSSREVDPQTLAKSIAERERDGWTFIYLGANQDAWAVGEQTGFSGRATGQAVNFRATPTGARAAMASLAADARDYLRGLESYAQARAASARRSITEHGDEVLTNIGASPGNPADPASVPAGRSRYADVGEALRQAKEATQR